MAESASRFALLCALVSCAHGVAGCSRSLLETPGAAPCCAGVSGGGAGDAAVLDAIFRDANGTDLDATVPFLEEHDPLTSGWVAGAASPGPVRLLAANGNHTCALLSDGEVACWGRTVEGQTDPLAGPFTGLVLGPVHSCGIRPDRTIECWGHLPPYSLRALEEPGLARDLCFGTGIACRVDDAKNTRCWEAGVGGGMQVLLEIEDIQCGTYACGLKRAGQLECTPDIAHALQSLRVEHGFGVGIFGQTCVIDRERNADCEGGTSVGGDRDVSGPFDAIACGALFCCAISPFGYAQCWGHAGYPGQLRNPRGTFIQIVTGDHHACALTSEGRVRCWGYDGEGQATPPFQIADTGE